MASGETWGLFLWHRKVPFQAHYGEKGSVSIKAWWNMCTVKYI